MCILAFSLSLNGVLQGLLGQCILVTYSKRTADHVTRNGSAAARNNEALWDLMD